MKIYSTFKIHWVLDDMSTPMHDQVKHLCSNSNVKGETVHRRILHHLKSIKDMVNNGINYQPQLVQDFWTINRMSTKPPPQFCVPQDMWRLSIARQGHATPLMGKLLWCFLHPRKLRWQWKTKYLKMCLLLKIVIFHCHVSFQEGKSKYQLS